MWKKGSMLGFAAIFLAVSIIFLPSSWAKTAKPKIIKPCKQCHQPKENILRGKFGNISERAETFQVLIGPATWIVSFDDETSITGAPSLAAIKKNKEVAVEITEKYGTLYTSRVSVKPPAKIPEDKLIKVGALAELVPWDLRRVTLFSSMHVLQKDTTKDTYRAQSPFMMPFLINTLTSFQRTRTGCLFTTAGAHLEC
jgi:hypothetical protein